MKSGPTTDELIALAEELIAASITPTLKGALRYNSLLVLSALAIARREISHCVPPANEPSIHVQQILVELAPNTADDVIRHDADAALARLIRIGAADDERLYQRVFRALAADNAEALSDVNPAFAETSSNI